MPAHGIVRNQTLVVPWFDETWRPGRDRIGEVSGSLEPVARYEVEIFPRLSRNRFRSVGGAALGARDQGASVA